MTYFKRQVKALKSCVLVYLAPSGFYCLEGVFAWRILLSLALAFSSLFLYAYYPFSTPDLPIKSSPQQVYYETSPQLQSSLQNPMILGVISGVDKEYSGMYSRDLECTATLKMGLSKPELKPIVSVSNKYMDNTNFFILLIRRLVVWSNPLYWMVIQNELTFDDESLFLLRTVEGPNWAILSLCQTLAVTGPWIYFGLQTGVWFWTGPRAPVVWQDNTYSEFGIENCWTSVIQNSVRAD